LDLVLKIGHQASLPRLACLCKGVIELLYILKTKSLNIKYSVSMLDKETLKGDGYNDHLTLRARLFLFLVSIFIC
jgi:hypothetical protein